MVYGVPQLRVLQLLTVLLENCCNTTWVYQCCNAVAISAVLHSYIWMAYRNTSLSERAETGDFTSIRPVLGITA
jgi:hypothetical protein